MNGPENPIGWCDYTWNPVTGCKHACTFAGASCYAEAIARRFAGGRAYPNGFEPAFHAERLAQPARVKEAARIFVCSMGDLWGSWVPTEWITATLEAMRAAPWHTFQSLTKAPWNVRGHDLPANLWMGATVNGDAHDARRLDAVAEFPARIRFLSCEPLCGPVDVARARPNWIIIGAATGPGGFQPDSHWRWDIEMWADENGVPIYHKDNLALNEGERRRHDFPDGSPARAHLTARQLSLLSP